MLTITPIREFLTTKKMSLRDFASVYGIAHNVVHKAISNGSNLLVVHDAESGQQLSVVELKIRWNAVANRSILDYIDLGLKESKNEKVGIPIKLL